MDQGQMVAKIALQRMLSTKLPEFGLTEHYIAFANISADVISMEAYWICTKSRKRFTYEFLSFNYTV